MRIQDLVEMAIPVAEGPVVWKEINKLLGQNKYKEAAAYFLKKGGTSRGLKRSWNVAQDNTKADRKLPSPIQGLLDKDHDYDKMKSEVEDLANKITVKKAKASGKTAAELEAEKKEDLRASADAYDTLARKKRRDELHAKEGTGKGSALLAKHAKRGEDIKDITKRKDELASLSKNFKRLDALLKKDESGAEMTREERRELSRLKDATAKARDRKSIRDDLIKDLNGINIKDSTTNKAQIEAAKKDLERILGRMIDLGLTVDDQKASKKVIKLIKLTVSAPITKKFHSGKISQEQMREELAEVEAFVKTAKRIFRNKSNSAEFNNLVDVATKIIKQGTGHIAAVDKILDKYDNGEDISLAELTSLKKKLVAMRPTLMSDVKNMARASNSDEKIPADFRDDPSKKDKSALLAYDNAISKITKLEQAGKEPDVDDIEDTLDVLSSYYTNTKKNAKAHVKKRAKEEAEAIKRKNYGLKEEILNNTKVTLTKLIK